MLGYTLVNIIFKNSSVQLGFAFKGYKAARDMLKELKVGSDTMQTFEDDFGCMAVIDLSTVAGVVLNDADKEIRKGVDTRLEQDIVMSRRIREEQANPVNRIVTQGKPVAADA